MDDEKPKQEGSQASSSHEASLEPITERREDLGKHNVHTHFPRDRNCEICKRTKITRAPCRRRKGEAVPRADNFGDFITADHKVPSDKCESRNNHRYARGAGSSHSMDAGVSVQKQNFTRNPEKHAEVLGTREEAKSHLHWEFLRIGKSLWRFFLESLHVYTTPIGDHWYSGRSSAQSKGRHFCCNAAIGCKWKLVVADSIECYNFLRNVKDLLFDGKTPYERRFGQTFKGPNRLFRLVHWLSITLFLRRICYASINLERKFYLYCSSDTLCTRGEFGRVTYWSQTEELETWTHRKSTQKDSVRKEVIFRRQGEFIFPIEDGRIKPPGGDQELRTSTLIRHRPIQGESNIDFLGESEGSLPQPHDSFPVAGEAMHDFLVHVGKLHVPPSRWTQSQTLLAEKRIIPYST